MNNDVRIPVDLLDAPDVTYKTGFFLRAPKALLYTFDLTPQAKMLWLVLEEHAGQNRKANAGQKRLAALMNLSVRSVSDYVNELRDQGWLVTHGSTGDTLSYTLAIPAVYGGSMDEDYRKKNTRTTLTVQPKDLKKLKNKLSSGIETKGNDYAVKFAVSVSHAAKQNLAGGGYEESCIGGMKNPAYPYAESCVTPYAESCVQTIRREQEEVTEKKERPSLAPAALDDGDYQREQISLVETDSPTLPLASEATAFGATFSASGTLGDRDFVSHSSGLAMVDVVEADASPTPGLVDTIADALVSPSGSSEINPGYSSVTTENYEDVHVYNETVTYLTDVNEATDAHVTASQAVEVPEVKKTPERPVKPIWDVPERREGEDLDRYEQRKHSSQKVHFSRMKNWKEADDRWERMYGSQKSTELSPEAQERLNRYKKFSF